MGGDDVLPTQIHMKGEEEKEKKKKKQKKKKKKKGTRGDMSHPLPIHEQFVHALHTCETCGKLFGSDADLQSHRKSRHPEEEEEEAKVKGEHASRLVLDVGTRGDMSHPDCHDGLLQEQEEEKLWSCKFCHLRFPDLQGHMQLVHYTCEICGVSFRSDAQLQSHRKSKHPGLKKKKKKKKKQKQKQKKKQKEEEEEEEEEGDKAKVKGEHASSFPIEKTMNKAPSPSPSISDESFPIEKTMNKAPSPPIYGESFPMEKVENRQEEESVFVMVEFDQNDSHTGAIYKIKLDQLQPLEHGKSAGGPKTDPSSLPMLEPVVKLFDKSWKMEEGLCLLDGTRFGSLSKLYIMVNEIPWDYLKPVTPKHAFFFDTSSLELQKISPPKTSKEYCLVISAYGMLYYLAQPMCFPQIQEPSFERYDPSSDSWESLPPFPDYSLHQAETEMTGYAVCYGYILLSMRTDKKYEAVAFHIHSRTWHKVKTSPENPYYYPFYGRAVVVGDTIYALAHSLNLVLVFSFWWDSGEDGDIAKRRHFLGTPLSLVLKDKFHPPCLLIGCRTQRLVHLGRQYFCVVQTGLNNDSLEYQYLCATTFRIAGQGQEMNIETVRSSIFRIAIEGNHEFEIKFSFTPDCNDIEPVEEQYFVSSALAERESAWTSKVKDDFFSFPTGPKLGLEAFRTKKVDEKKEEKKDTRSQNVPGFVVPLGYHRIF